jgi:PAS domain S-box-containing protein
MPTTHLHLDDSLPVPAPAPNDGVYVLDRVWRIVDINDQALQHLNVGRAEAVGATLWSLAPGLIGTDCESHYRLAMESRTVQEFVGPSAAKEGCWLDVRVFPVPQGLAVHLRDITTRVQLEAKLRDREQLLSAIFGQANAGFAQVDLGGRFALVNDACCAITGYGREQLMKLRMQDITHPDDLAGNLEQLRAALAGKNSFVIEKRYVRPDGCAVWVNNSVTVLRSDAGEPIGILAVTTDRTEAKRAEQQLRESEKSFRLMADAVPQIVWITNAEGEAEFFNRQWTDYTGVPYQRTTAAQVAADHVHPEDGPATIEVFDEARRTGTTFQVEHRIRSKNGEYRWFLVRSVPYRDPGTGEIVRWFGASVDIHDRKLAEAALHDLNETLEAQVAARSAERDRLWNLSQDMLARADYGGMMSAVSPAWTQVLGWNEAELLARPYADFMHPDDMPPTLDAIGHMAQTRLPARFENRIATSDGGYKHIEWTVAPEPDGEHFIAVGRDLSAAKAREAELEAAQEALRQSQKMEAMGSLTGGVAHDFNNLLTPIIGSLDMLVRKGVGSERERRLIDGALQSAERAKTLVQRLLAFARRQPLQATAVDTARLIEGMAGLIGSTVGPTIDVRIDVAADVPPAKADINQLEMALLNLAVNARDAMPDGGEIVIAARRTSVHRQHSSGVKPGHYVQLSVSDTGLGMDEATQRRAIEPFFSTKGIGKGTGLGLSMVHGLAAQLGGGLTITSAPGAGTTVTLWLPISTGPIGSDEDVPVAPDVPMGRGTALLVDDEDLVRMSTADMLNDFGFEVVEVGLAEEALRHLKSGRKPDLLVTDHLMPGMNGAELACEARALYPDLPILIVSGYAEVDGIATDLPRMTKPFRNADLAASLSALLPQRAS